MADKSDLQKLVTRYEVSINDLKRNIIQQDILIKTLTEEQESNSIEFEKVCKENSSLKKKVSEKEKDYACLQIEIQELDEKVVALNKERESYENEILRGIQPLQIKLDELQRNYNSLQVKHSNLQLDSTDRLLLNKKCKLILHKKILRTKKMSVTTKRKIIVKLNNKCLELTKELEKLRANKHQTIESKYHETGHCDVEQEIKSQIADSLLQQNNILLSELQNRNEMIEYLQNENAKILEIIYKYEKELNKTERTTATLQFVDKQINQIQKLLECDLAISCEHHKSVERENSSDLMLRAEVPLPAVLAKHHITVNPRNPTAKLKDTQKYSENVHIFSDSHGIGLGSFLSIHTSKNVQNTCSPGSSLKNILTCLHSQALKTPECLYVLLVGEFNTISRKDFNDCRSMIDDVSNVANIVICTMPYGKNERYNRFIYSVNTDLYNLASRSDNIHLIDINNNNINDMRIHNTSKYFQTLFKLLLSRIDTPFGTNKSVINIITSSVTNVRAATGIDSGSALVSVSDSIVADSKMPDESTVAGAGSIVVNNSLSEIVNVTQNAMVTNTTVHFLEPGRPRSRSR